jgi:RES domain-containing protein
MPDATLIERVDVLSRVPLEAEAFRHAGPGYPPLSTEGARVHGGRWNPPDSFPVLYVALSRESVVAEFYRLAQRQSMAPENLLPRRMNRYQVRLTAVLDLRSLPTLATVGLVAADLQADDPSRCQAVGNAAHYVGFEAVWAASATGVGEIVAVFYDRLLPDSFIDPVDVEEWSSLPPRLG